MIPVEGISSKRLIFPSKHVCSKLDHCLYIFSNVAEMKRDVEKLRGKWANFKSKVVIKNAIGGGPRQSLWNGRHYLLNTSQRKKNKKYGLVSGIQSSLDTIHASQISQAHVITCTQLSEARQGGKQIAQSQIFTTRYLILKLQKPLKCTKHVSNYLNP